jgi:spore maturation protein CgeB
MRIFYASDVTPNAAFESNLWRNNLYLPLVDLGHNVVEFQYDLQETFRNLDPSDRVQQAFIKKNRPKLSMELLRQIKAAHLLKPIDLFFSYFYDACVLPETIDEIRGMGIQTVNWYCNGSYQLELVSEISPHYDWCLVPEKFRLQDYALMGARTIYCQEAANPNIYTPYDLPKDYDVVFIGQAYGERPAYIHYLIEQDINLRVWGYGWDSYTPKVNRKGINPIKRARRIAQRLLKPDGFQTVIEKSLSMLNRSSESPPENKLELPIAIIGSPLSDIEMIKMYSRTKINLGFSSVGNTHQTDQRIVQIRLRDFEVPMSGGFYMVEYMEELEEFFDIGQEIVCYTSREELVDKIKYYLRNEDEREAIRVKGYERCQRDHTWHRRFKMAFAHMGLE